MAKARRLKVFQAQFGFYDTVVAAPSQAAALRAWGTHQDLFASGQAKATKDAQAMKSALQHPETPLRRAVGSQDPFCLKPANLPKIPKAPKKVGRRPAPEGRRQVDPPKPAADRSKLDHAETALRSLDEDRKRQEAKFKRREEALEAEIESAQDAYVDARKAATTAVTQARRAFREAGGGD